ncbi:MAG TPA: hypothetical protein VEB86_02910 [Chryseosolibacter sp.]|nr:hypothetical protein [Chryseosolibacter sp.]
MYQGLLITHSYLRYIILLMLVIVIIVSLVGLANKVPFSKRHDKAGLFLFICAHTQLLVGLILYVVSMSAGYRVQFNDQTMKSPALRYFAVEHLTMMLVAIALITIARISAKKTPVDQKKHMRMFVYNLLALVLIIVTVYALGGEYNTY